MSRQRPTLQLADWRIATNLTATRSVQDDATYPAHGCGCRWCTEWRRLHSVILPPEQFSQFTRIGILTEHPADIYNYQSDEAADYLRVVFGFVGRVMNGPNPWIQDPEQGMRRNYRTLRRDPFLSLAVHRHEDLHYKPPGSYDPATGHYLIADFRLAIPSTASTADR